MAINISDEKLIHQYLGGDEKSLEFLIAKYLKPIYGFIYKNVGDSAQAEDITQEVFLRVWKNLKKFDQNKNFKPWLFQIAKNASIDFLRKKKTVSFSRFENEKGQNVFIENIVAKPANLIGKLSDKKVLSTAMQGLDQKEQKIIKMRHDDGLSFKEIADILKKPLNTIKSRHRRILLRLRRNIIEKNGREPKA